MYSLGTDEYITYAVKKYSASLLRLSYTILNCKQDSEDAVQEAFIKLITVRPNFKDTEHEKAWLIRVTVNISRNMLKKSKRCTCVEDEPLHTVTANEPSSEILDAVLSLSERYSTVLHLYYYEDYSIKEISEILKLPVHTVGTRLSRGRAILKKQLKGDFEYEY